MAAMLGATARVGDPDDRGPGPWVGQFVFPAGEAPKTIQKRVLISRNCKSSRSDFWEVHEDSTFGGRKGTEYRRVHVQERQALFTPVGTQCPIDPKELDDLRVTKMQSVVPSDALTYPTKISGFSDSSTSFPQTVTKTLQDSWREARPDPHRRVAVPGGTDKWRGSTSFWAKSEQRRWPTFEAGPHGPCGVWEFVDRNVQHFQNHAGRGRAALVKDLQEDYLCV